MASPVLLHIERREYKYLIDGDTAAGIREALLPFCEIDPYAQDRPGGRYAIESLYLDTPDLQLFHANATERVDRVKMRIRTYPETPGAPFFFEVKRRVNDVIVKTRGRAPSDWRRLFEEPLCPVPLARGGREGAAIERFVAIARSYNLQPTALVRYEREPYASTIDDYARVTFDRRIVSQLAEDYSFTHEPRGWRANDNAELAGHTASPTILELKFTAALPSWMMHIVQRFDLMRRAFSKYGTSILTWHLAPGRRRLGRRRILI